MKILKTSKSTHLTEVSAIAAQKMKFPVDLVTFTEKSLMENIIFSALL